jgi:acetamidase/formamidase
LAVGDWQLVMGDGLVAWLAFESSMSRFLSVGARHGVPVRGDEGRLPIIPHLPGYQKKMREWEKLRIMQK